LFLQFVGDITVQTETHSQQRHRLGYVRGIVSGGYVHRLY
jgi:hypothetical protein